MGGDWQNSSAPESSSLHLGSLVCSFYRSYGNGRAADNSRFRRLSQGVVEFQYSAPGSIELAKRVQELLPNVPLRLDESWGLDHGTWSVLCHVFPDADIPVVQLSIDKTQPPEFHYELAKRLAPLRDEGVLIIGNGNIVHNLRFFSPTANSDLPLDWAVRFDNQVRRAVVSGNHESLINYESFGQDARLSVPTPEHYLPLLYVLGMQRETDEISFPVEGFDGGGLISMLSVQIG